MVNGKPKVFYMIVVKSNGLKYQIQRRFNDFSFVNSQLSRDHGNLPKLPGKTLFSLKKREDLDGRRSQLCNYLQVLVQREDICSSEHFKLFLEVKNTHYYYNYYYYYHPLQD